MAQRSKSSALLQLLLLTVSSASALAFHSALLSRTSAPLSISRSDRTLQSIDFPSGVNFFAAAACCGQGPKCTAKHASNSKLCSTGLWMTAQRQHCQQAACFYCRLRNAAGVQVNRQRVVCKRTPILFNCFGRQPRPSCVHKGRNGKVVIPAWRIPIRGDWARTNNGYAIQWKPGGGNGIDQPAEGNPICLRFTPDVTSLHYFTAITSAPHVTEHNDAWFRFASGMGLYRYQPRTKSLLGPSTEWYKGYQNVGGDKRANYIINVNFNGHQFVTPRLTKGKTYRVCISGRSSKYSIFKLVMVACPEDAHEDWPKRLYKCSRFSRYMRSAMQSTSASSCV